LALSSCTYPYAGTYQTGGSVALGYRSGAPLQSYTVRSAPLHRSYYSGSTAYACGQPYRMSSGTSYAYGTQSIARPYYANYGFGRPYEGSTWYRTPYTSTWRDPGYLPYNNYGSPQVSYGVPMSHYGGWSYTQRPIGWNSCSY
jgi:hypothetical protein